MKLWRLAPVILFSQCALAGWVSTDDEYAISELNTVVACIKMKHISMDERRFLKWHIDARRLSIGRADSGMYDYRSWQKHLKAEPLDAQVETCEQSLHDAKKIESKIKALVYRK